MKKKILIIDCDPGIDDAFALFYAMAEERLDLRLITTVSGNVDVNKTTRNAQRIVAMANKNIDIARGADQPLVAPPFYAANVHGENGMGNYEFPNNEVLAPLLKESAVEAMYRVLSEASEPVIIAPVGPLTNIAELLIVHPDIKNKIDHLAIMGGGLKGGNTTPAAEFNFYVDPEAAALVFQSGIPIVMAGLDVTETASLRKEHMEKLSSFGDVGKFLADVVCNMNGEKELHDAIAIMSIFEMEDFSYEDLHISIETQGIHCRGYSLADQKMNNRQAPNARVILSLNHSKFIEKLYKNLEYYKDI